MDFKRLRTFVTVADLGTVSKAALRLRISQSALSRQIADLELECGFKLFDRIGRRLFLTTRGDQLLGDCRGGPGPDGIARRACRVAQARRRRRAQGRRTTPDDRERAGNIPAALFKELPGCAREADRGARNGAGAPPRAGGCAPADSSRSGREPMARELRVAVR